jgi:hypothetical protein
MRRSVSLLLLLTLLASTGCAASRAFRQAPPRIPIKFIGMVEKSGGEKWAIFTDGPGVPVWAAEGDTVLGQWKLVRIGVASVVMEYPDGTGRQTIPMRGGRQ